MRYLFANCVLDTESYRFLRDGRPVPIEPQVFDLLRLLVENAGRIVTKDELIEAIWGGRIVSEATISARISAARAAVGDTGQAQAVIRTLVRRGFELVVPVERATAAPPASAPEVEAGPAPKATERQRIRYAMSRDGAKIAWAVSGKGPPLLRAGHHVTHLERDWQSRLWRPEFDRLSAGHTLVRYDIRGSGLSDPLRPGDGIEAHVEDVAAVIEAAGLERFPMIATLQNTAVAVRYIAENPGRVSRLVILCGYVRGRAVRENAPADPDADPSIALLREGWGDPTNGFMRAWLSMFFPAARYEEITEFIELIGAACRPEDIAAQRRVVDSLDAEAWLGRVDAPTLVIHPRSCAPHPLSEGQLIARGVPNAELMVVDGSNVACLPSDPAWEDQIAATLAFLDEG